MRPRRLAALRRAGIAAALAVLLGACERAVLGPDPSRDRVAVFDAAWSAFDAHFAYFADQGLDWDAVRARLRPRAEAAANDQALYDVVCELVRATRSYHSVLVDQGGRRCGPDFAFAATRDPALVARYLAEPARPTASRQMAYARLSADRGGAGIGYVWVPAFGGDGWGAEIDDALAALGDVRGVVIDARGNTGGNDGNARAIAARFADAERAYVRRRFRTGPARDAFGPWVTTSLAPAGRRFAGPVVLLTDRRVASAAESFTLMLRALPTVVVIGDTTSGTASNPLPRDLPNGWWVTVPQSQETTPDGTVPIEGRGIAPAVVVRPAAGDAARGVDRMLEAAIASVRQRLGGAR